MTLTKEWLLKTIAELEEERDATPGAVNEDAAMALAAMKMALTSMTTEPALTVGDGGDALAYRRLIQNFAPGTKLYTAPPAPVVPDERYQHLSELYHAQEKRLLKLAQLIKGPSFDKYAYSTSQAIDVLETAIFGEKEDNVSECCAVMLQESDPESQSYTLPLDYLQGNKDGLEWAARLAEANHPQTGDWLYDDPLELAKAIRKGSDMPEADGNSPAIPDDVRRMDWLVSKTVDVREPMVYGSHSLFWSQTITDEEDDYHATKLREQIDAAMAAENEAAPQQEAKNV